MRVFAFAAGLALVPALVCAAEALPLDALHLPPGFHIAQFARVPNARAMALGADGTLFVGSMDAGKVYAVTPTADGTHADTVRTVARGLRMPVGVAFKDGALYVSAVDRILRFEAIEAHLDDPPKARVITDKLPADAAHGWRFIAFGPDGRLYVPVGAPCNTCDPGKDYARLLSMRADGSDWRDVALGIRNTVGFDWQPDTKQLWFTDNGRDLLGDDLPSDELNRVTRAGEHFGYPYCHQGDTPDPEFGNGKSCRDYTPPAAELGAHVASLGMRFYSGSMFPDAYRGAVIVAEHGSWNRSRKSGYRVVAVKVDGARVTGQDVLVDGFQHDERARGRPVDVLVMPDGALLVSDDLAGAVYRISWSKPVSPTRG